MTHFLREVTEISTVNEFNITNIKCKQERLWSFDLARNVLIENKTRGKHEGDLRTTQQSQRATKLYGGQKSS